MTIKLKVFPTPPETLNFTRKKNKWIFGSILYRLNRISNLIFGKIFTIRFLLNLELLIWRLAYENSYKYFGKEFPNQVYGIDSKLLTKYGFPGCNIIDIGCGQGRLSVMAASCIAGSVLGVDYDLVSINIAKKNNSDNKIEYIHGNALKLKICKKYDLAIMAGVLEHLDDAQDFLIKLHSIAKRIVIEVPDIEADQLNIVRYSFGTRLYSDNDHIREYTLDSLVKQIEIANWKILYVARRGQVITVVADE